LRVPERISQLVPHLTVEGVALPWTVQCEQENCPVAFFEDRLARWTRHRPAIARGARSCPRIACAAGATAAARDRPTICAADVLPMGRPIQRDGGCKRGAFGVSCGDRGRGQRGDFVIAWYAISRPLSSAV